MNTLFRHLLLVALLTVLIAGSASAQRVSVGFYNVENLFDTIASPFGGDAEYTPLGRNKWTSERYRYKLAALARVIDSLNVDVLGLCEVENEEVIKDLVRNLGQDYCYEHRTTSDSRGLDMALLYKADMFIPEYTTQIHSESRQPLVVKGELIGQKVAFVVCHLPSVMNERSMRDKALLRLTEGCMEIEKSGEHSIILMGDFNFDTADAALRRASSKNRNMWRFISGFNNPIGEKHSSIGSYNYAGRWTLYDNVFLSKRLQYNKLRPLNAGVFLREFMILDSRQTPDRRAIRGRQRYLCSASDHLPVFVVLEQQR